MIGPHAHEIGSHLTGLCAICNRPESDPIHPPEESFSAFSASSAGAVTADPWLDPASAAFSGLPGLVVRSLEAHSEADPAAILLTFLTEFGSMVGPMAEVKVGFAHHPPALFVALVGRTSRSRKGTATADMGGLMRHVEEGWHQRHQVSGFGSGEALVEHASNQPGEAIYMVESELARVLAVASREGSSASSALRSAWDFQRMEHRIRRHVYDAPPAPVSMVGHITLSELRDDRHGLRPVEVMNGFGNRVLWIFVDRRRIVPNLEPIPQEVLTPLVRRIREALVAGRKAGAVRRSPDADDLWADLYRRMADDDGAGLVDALTARAEAQVLRLSLIYALTDGKNEIARGHLEAAWEVWRYCRWSAQRVWVGRGTGDPDVDRIAAILAGGQDLTSTGLDRMFNGHRNTEELRDKVVGFGIGQVVRRSTGGRDAIVLTSAENEEKAEKGSDLRLWWTRPTFLRPPQEHVTDVTDVTLHATATGDFPSVPIDPLSQGSLAEELGAYVRNWNAGMQRWDDGHEG